jgi:RNA polymerase sigma-70 factor (ECF subfamily)
MAQTPPAAAAVVASFEDFFEAERRRLFGAVYVMVGDADEAEEIVQDAFLAVWERWDRVRDMDRPTGYLYRTAMNGFRSRRRRLVRAARRMLPFDEPKDPYAVVDLHDEVVRAIRSLPPRQRAAVALTELLGYGSEEAAGLLDVKAATVRNLAAQGRCALKRAMEQRDG